MAERRMFSKSICDSDKFLDMPGSTQLLYFHLGLHADDDGFVASPQKIMRTLGSSNDDFKLLRAKEFIIPFESGICVITHWKVNNYLRSDRHKPTIHQREMALLSENSSFEYTLSSFENESIGIPNYNQSPTIGIPTDNQPPTNCLPTGSIGKVSIVEDSLGKEKDSVPSGPTRNNFKPPTLEEVKTYFQEKQTDIDPEEFYSHYESVSWYRGKTKITNWKQCLATWEKKRKTDGFPKGPHQQAARQQLPTAEEDAEIARQRRDKVMNEVFEW